jgi:ATP-dependent RNA helicase DDX59
VDILSNHSGSLDVSSIQIVVLDEVDSLLLMGFDKQIHTIMSHLPAHRQTLLFSATIPQQIKSLADEMLHNPLNISIGKSKDSSVTANITHTVLWVEEDCKKTRLFTFLNDKDTYHPPVVVFVNSRRGTLLLASAIDKVIYCVH